MAVIPLRVVPLQWCCGWFACLLVRLSNMILESAQEVFVGFANTVLSEHVVNLVVPVVREVLVVVVFCLVRGPRRLSVSGG